MGNLVGVNVYEMCGFKLQMGPSSLNDWTFSKSHSFTLLPKATESELIALSDKFIIEEPLVATQPIHLDTNSQTPLPLQKTDSNNGPSSLTAFISSNEMEIESSRNNGNPSFIQYAHKNIPYFKSNFSNDPHENYFGLSDDGNLVFVSISLQGALLEDQLWYFSPLFCLIIFAFFSSNTNLRFFFSSFLYSQIFRSQKVQLSQLILIPFYCFRKRTRYYKTLVRTFEEDSRILICCENPKERIKALRQHPLLCNFKLQFLKDNAITNSLIQFEQNQLESSKYKFGVVYRKSGQKSDDELLSNNEPSTHFTEFLEFIGTKTPLLGFQNFRGGLDTNSNATGTDTFYTRFNDFEIVFHVSTLLPFDPNNPQQLQRKCHIGNDVVVIIFQDPNTDKFSPDCFTSHFNHVFVVIQKCNQEEAPDPDFTYYKFVIYSLFPSFSFY